MVLNHPKKDLRFTLTVDCGLMRDENLNPAIEQLRRWEAQGRIVIFESDRSKFSPQSAPPKRSGWMKTIPPVKAHGRVNFANLAFILFPHRDRNRLNMAEINDISHLIHHFQHHRSFFVTTNAANFIQSGKQEQLASMNVIVLTPEEAVRLIEATSPLLNLDKRVNEQRSLA